jgi:hypothetical protein
MTKSRSVSRMPHAPDDCPGNFADSALPLHVGTGMKTIGILGGMSGEWTALYYQVINR